MRAYSIALPGPLAAGAASPFERVGALLCEEPETRVEKMRGLLFRSGLSPGRVMLLRRCRLIHTVGMRFALDVVFLDAAGAAVKTVRGLSPGRFAFGGLRARHTVEAAAGWLPDGVAFKRVLGGGR